MSVGSFVVLERAKDGVRVVDWMDGIQVKAGHRYERRPAACQIISGGELGEDLPENDDIDDALQLIEEAERFLREQEPRCSPCAPSRIPATPTRLAPVHRLCPPQRDPHSIAVIRWLQ